METSEILKRELASRFANDTAAYNQAKTALCDEIDQKASLADSDGDAVRQMYRTIQGIWNGSNLM